MNPLLVSRRTWKSSGARRFISGASGWRRKAGRTVAECRGILHESNSNAPATALNSVKPKLRSCRRGRGGRGHPGVRPSSGAATWLSSSHETFPNRPSIPRCCGRDGRTPLTQKFHFGFRVKLGFIQNIRRKGRFYFRSVFLRNFARYFFHKIALVWLPCPTVCLLNGITMAWPC